MSKSPLLLSKRLWLFLAVLAAIVYLKSAPLIITGGLIILLAVTFPATLRPLRFLRFWIAIILLVFIVPVFAGPQDARLLGISYSSAKLAQTTLMALRGIVIFLLIQVLTYNLNSERFNSLLSRYGSENFTTLYDLSRQIIPNTRHILNNRFRGQRSLAWLRPGQALDLLSSVFVDLIHLVHRLENPLGPRLPGDPIAAIEQVRNGLKPALVIITGGPGAGKTSWLKSLYQELRSQGIPGNGILTLREYAPDHQSWQLVMTVLHSGIARILGRMEPFDQAVATENYFIDPTTLEWGAQHLDGLSDDWLIVDEIGIFEFDRQGFYPALQKLGERFTGVLVLGLRKSLLPDLDRFLGRNLPLLKDWQRYYLLLDED